MRLSPSDAHELREVIKVPVSCVQNKIVLENNRCQPHIVGRDRGSLFSELPEQRAIVMRGLLIGKDDVHTILEEKGSQRTLVLCLTTSVRKAGPQLAEYNER